MKLIQELLLLEIRDFGDWMKDQGRKAPDPEPEVHRDADKIVSDTYKKLKELGVKNIIRTVVNDWLTGGGGFNLADLLGQLEKLGYDSGWTTWEDNEEFWKKLGVSKKDLNTLAHD